MSKIKEIIKGIPFCKKILNKKNNIKSRKKISDNARKYESAFLEYSTSYPELNDPLYYRREIIIGTHIIEKGLSHYDYRPGFGKDVVINLQHNIKRYSVSGVIDQFAVNNAIKMLYNYHSINMQHNFDDSDYVDPSIFKEVNEATFLPYDLINSEYENMNFFELAHSRHSVRNYNGNSLPIEESTILEAIDLASTAPSACNRQATRVFVFKGKDILKKIEDLHGGCKNFGANASLILLITSDLSLYSRNEVKIPAYDAGIFSMNLLYALQTKGLYTCILNGSFPGESYHKIHEITSIPTKYDINGMVAVYKLNQTDKIKIAASPRRMSEDIVTFI